MLKHFAKKLDLDIPLPLRDHVIGAILGESRSNIQMSCPALPTGFPLFVYIFKDIPLIHNNGQKHKPQSRLVVSGQINHTNTTFEVEGEFGQIGIVLHPTATYYLFHKNGDFFLNQSLSIKEICGVDPHDLLQALSKCGSPEQYSELLLDFLSRLAQNRLPAIDWLDTSLVEIFRSNGHITQAELVERTGVSPRHFRRKFKEVIGVAPKYFCKVVQMNTVFELLKAKESEKLHHLALDCGYYDQAHFINDFNRVIGDSPGGFLNGEHAIMKTYLGRDMR